MRTGDCRRYLGETRVTASLVLEAIVEHEDVVSLAVPLADEARASSQRSRLGTDLLSASEPFRSEIDAFANAVRQVTMHT